MMAGSIKMLLLVCSSHFSPHAILIFSSSISMLRALMRISPWFTRIILRLRKYESWLATHVQSYRRRVGSLQLSNDQSERLASEPTMQFSKVCPSNGLLKKQIAPTLITCTPGAMMTRLFLGRGDVIGGNILAAMKWAWGRRNAGGVVVFTQRNCGRPPGREGPAAANPAQKGGDSPGTRLD